MKFFLLCICCILSLSLADSCKRSLKNSVSTILSDVSETLYNLEVAGVRIFYTDPVPCDGSSMILPPLLYSDSHQQFVLSEPLPCEEHQIILPKAMDTTYTQPITVNEINMQSTVTNLAPENIVQVTDKNIQLAAPQVLPEVANLVDEEKSHLNVPSEIQLVTADTKVINNNPDNTEIKLSNFDQIHEENTESNMTPMVPKFIEHNESLISSEAIAIPHPCYECDHDVTVDLSGSSSNHIVENGYHFSHSLTKEGSFESKHSTNELGFIDGIHSNSVDSSFASSKSLSTATSGGAWTKTETNSIGNGIAGANADALSESLHGVAGSSSDSLSMNDKVETSTIGTVFGDMVSGASSNALNEGSLSHSFSLALGDDDTALTKAQGFSGFGDISMSNAVASTDN